MAVLALLITVAFVLSCGSDSKAPPAGEQRSPAETASFDYPVRIADAGGGVLAVTDFSLSRVVFVNTATYEVVRRFTVPGNPVSVAVVSNTVFVGIPERTERGMKKGGNVTAFDMKGKYLYTLGSADHGYGAVRNPVDIAVDEADDRIFVLDGVSKSIRAYMINGTLYSEFPVGSNSEPNALAIDIETDLLFVGDSVVNSKSNFAGTIFNSGIRTFDYAGSASSVIDVVDDLADEFRFSHPMGIDLDLSGHLMVTDMIQNRVVVINTTGEGVRTFAKKDIPQGTVFLPADIFVDDSGDVYVTEGRYGRLTAFSGEGL